jgi:hypothetical protein
MLTIRQRLKLGLTVANITEIAKTLKAEGEIDENTSHSEIAAAIAVRLATKNSDEFAAVGLDLDTVIQFIERLLPLILKLIELFS